MSLIYLINPSERAILDNAGDRVPLGLLSIASNMSQRHPVRVYDLNHDSEEGLFNDFEKQSPEVVGISVYTSPAEPEAIRLAKKFKGRTHLIAGGVHASFMGQRLLRFFDSVIIGEGEDLGMAMQRKGLFYANPVNLDFLPYLSRKKVDMKRYGIDQSGRRTGTLITSRGCPYHCAFCGKLEDTVRFVPMDNVLAEIDELKELGFNALYFLDDVFTLNPARMQTIGRYAQRLRLPYRATTRSNLLNSNKVRILADTGCEWLSLGLESGNDEVLKRCNKQTTVQQNTQAIELAHSHGIKVKGFFILGLPGETEESARHTIEYARKMRERGLTNADFYFLTPFPGTPIWEKPEKYGIEITDRDFTKYLEAGKGARCFINTKDLKANRIEELVQEAKEQWK